MTRSTSTLTVADEPSFEVPDLDLPAPGIPRAVAARSEAPSAYDHGYRYEFELTDRNATKDVLELDCDSRPREVANRFVSGHAEPMIPISRFRSCLPEPSLPMSTAAPTRLDTAVDAIQTIPVSVWKRVPAYAFLALFLGNGCKCGGLSMGTNLALVVLLVVGLVGLTGSLRQRSP